MLRPNELYIDDSFPVSDKYVVNGEVKSTGAIQRDWSKGSPRSCHAVPSDLKLIPRSEWSERIKEQERTKSRLSDIRLTANNGRPIPSLDQNGKGYCWAHSSTAAVMLTRAIMGEPYVPLSAYAVACMEKNFRDEGGWGAESLDFISHRGVPSAEFWPMKSMSRANDNSATWENAARHKVVDGWVDLQQEQYDRKLNFDQVATLLLCRVPVVCDFNWWGHSVCALDLVEPSPGQFGIRILNSWGDDWSDRGMGVLSPAKSIPNGAVAPRVLVTSLV